MPNSCRTIVKKCLHKGAINQKEYEKLMRKIDIVQGVTEGLNSDPCIACKWYPPSSFDGKPCTMCPAEGKEKDESTD